MIKLENESYLLHKLDLQTGKIVKSFFKSPFQLGDYGGILHSTGSLVNAVSDGNFIYAFISFMNKMFIFDYDGNFVNSKSIDYQHFSILEEQERQLNGEEILALATSHSLITDIIWKNDSTLIVPYYKFTRLNPASGTSNGSLEGFTSFAEIDLEGNVLFEVENTPRIYDFNQKTNHYLIWDSHSLEKDIQRVIYGNIE